MSERVHLALTAIVHSVTDCRGDVTNECQLMLNNHVVASWPVPEGVMTRHAVDPAFVQQFVASKFWALFHPQNRESEPSEG